MDRYRTQIFIAFLFITFNINAAHIGDVKVKRIRNFSPTYVVVHLDKAILNPPACATVFDKIVVSGTDSDWGNQKLSMLMTAMAAGFTVNPYCTDACQSNWEGEMMICVEISIEK